THHHHLLHSFPTRRSSDLARHDELLVHAPGRRREGPCEKVKNRSSSFPRRSSTPRGSSRAFAVTWRIINRGCSIRLTFPFCRARSEEHTSELQSRGHLVCR